MSKIEKGAFSLVLTSVLKCPNSFRIMTVAPITCPVKTGVTWEITCLTKKTELFEVTVIFLGN